MMARRMSSLITAMKTPSTRRKLVITLIVMLSIAAAVTYWGDSKVRSLMCDEAEGKEMLVKLCYDYIYVLATGDLCHDLCKTITIHYQTCLNRKRGKHVFLMEYQGKQLIFKSKFRRINDILPAVRIRDVADGTSSAAPGMRSLMTLFENSAYYNRDFPVIEEAETQRQRRHKGSSNSGTGVIDLMNMAVSERHRLAAENTMWSLLQQEEYVMLRYLQGHVNVPKLYGSCGHFYLVESNPPWQDRDLWTWIGMARNSDWNTRVRIALEIMDVVKVLSDDLDEELHMCDVKLQNFGLDSNGTVSLIDVDYVLFDSTLRMKTRTIIRCTEHSDCDEHDCQGWCDFVTGKCYSGRVNNNFQAVCQKIFLPDWTNDLTGLLRHPPASVSTELGTILDRCSNPHPSLASLPGCFSALNGNVICRQQAESTRKFAASEEDFTNLYDLLKGEAMVQDHL